MSRRIAIAFTSVLATSLAACPSSRVGKGPRAAVVQEEGAELYAEYCALCHGDRGQGYAADDANALTNQDFLRTADDRFLYTAISRGRPGTAMAAYADRFGGPLDRDEVTILVEWLRSHQTEPSVELPKAPVTGDAAAGKAVYEKRCVGCHGEAGKGNTAISLSNPMFLYSASDAYIRWAIAHGRRGTPMPAFEGRLEPEQIDDLTRYVRSLATNVPADPEGEVPPSFTQIVIHPDGPPPAFSPLREGRYVPADEVKAALDAGARMVILDARPTSDWLRSHIPGALPVPYYEPEKMIASLPRDGTWIISYCGCPHAASGKVMDALRADGFENTAVIDEGIFHWMSQDYPITHGADGAAASPSPSPSAPPASSAPAAAPPTPDP